MADREGLNAQAGARQHLRAAGQQAAVAVELQPRTGRDKLRDRGVDCRPADLHARGPLDPAAGQHAQRLSAEADPQDGDPCLVGITKQGLFRGDPRQVIVHRRVSTRHHDAVDAVQGGQRTVIGQQVITQYRAAVLEGLGDEASGIHIMMLDHEHAHRSDPPGRLLPNHLSYPMPSLPGRPRQEHRVTARVFT